MAFSYLNWDRISSEANTNVRRIFAYYNTSDTLATIEAAGYFLPVYRNLRVGDVIYLTASDGNDVVFVTAVSSTALTVTTYAAVPAGSIVNSQINAAAAIDFSKLATLTSGNLLVGSAGGVPTSVAMSGDATMVASGALTIAANAVTSAKTSALMLQYTTVAITAAQFNGMYAAPKLLVAAPGANKIIALDKVQLVMTYVSANYAAGGVVAVQFDSTINGAGVIASSTLTAANMQAAASTVFNMNAGIVLEPFTTCANKGLYLSNITGAFTTGDSTFVAHVWYKIIPTV